jgi:hypothetical protein
MHLLLLITLAACVSVSTGAKVDQQSLLLRDHPELIP